MSRGTHDLLGIVNSILYTTLLEADKVKADRHEVNVGDFLTELRSSVSVPREKDLDLIWDCHSNLPTIMILSEVADGKAHGGENMTQGSL